MLWVDAPPIHAYPHNGCTAQLVQLAAAAGWAPPTVCSPGEMLAGAVMLALGHQYIPIRHIPYDDTQSLEANNQFLAMVLAEMADAFFMEQYLVLTGFPRASLCAATDQAQLSKLRRLHVGDLPAYALWVAVRRGALQDLPAHSFLRDLLEPFTCVTLSRKLQVPPPVKPAPTTSDIDPSFQFGYEGSLATEHLLALLLGRNNVKNVEKDTAYQKADIDLIARAADRDISVEVKTESYVFGNLAYEWTSNATINSPGWLRYSKTDVLVNIIWPTGDVFIQDFREVRDWILKNRHRYPLKYGSNANQSYKSQLYPIPIRDIMTANRQVIHVPLHSWIPETKALQGTSLLPAKFRHRSLLPNLLPG